MQESFKNSLVTSVSDSKQYYLVGWTTELVGPFSAPVFGQEVVCEERCCLGGVRGAL